MRVLLVLGLMGGLVSNLGAETWARTYGGTGVEAAHSVRTTPGGLLVAATTGSFGAGNQDYWILRLDSQGEILSQIRIGSSTLEREPAARITTGEVGGPFWSATRVRRAGMPGS